VRLDGLPLDGGGGGSPSTATFLWEIVCDIDFTQEEDQALSGGNLTLTNRVNNAAVVLAGQTVAVVSGKLELTGAASSNLGVSGASTRTGAFLVADIDVIWPSFDGQPLRWGAEVSAAPTFDASNRAWGVFAENAAGLGGGGNGLGYSAEVRGTGAGAATRQSRHQGAAPPGVAALSSTAYAAGLVCGIGLDGNGPVGLWSLNAGDVGELDTIAALGSIGTSGGAFSGAPITGISRLGVFAVASGAGSFVASVERLVLWARVPTVGP